MCTGVNRGLLTICTNSTDFLPASVSVVAVNCDLLGSPSTLIPYSFRVRGLFPYSVALAG
jgi:hypothetical protein